jgi:L,D-transpeptidase YcbB
MMTLLVRLLTFALALATACTTAAQPLPWFDAGRPTREASEAVQVLLDARAEGLDPRDYDAAGLAALLRQPPLTAAAQAQADAALTAALQRYLADLRNGRVDPRSLGAKFTAARRAAEDSTALLREAIAAHRVAQVLHDAEPRLPMYANLRAALARYRALGEHPAWQFALRPLPRGRKLLPGQPYAGTQLLAQRFAALGDLDAGMPTPQHFDGALVEALQAFQERHGLTPDGVLGPSTLQQLAVTPAQRARQIELTMERLRWTPFLQGPRMIVINVPEFVLRAYEVNDGRVAVRLAMKVIVGKALRTRTPLLGEELRFIEFSPFWNVPPSIAHGETLPRLRRDPAYFAREGLEFVTPTGQVVTTLSAANLDAVAQRGWRIRQRPGAQNALGGIKFVFPNNDNIYLHDTPSRQLFERDRRDFSHGCIRIEAPVALAKLVLEDEPGWSEERILAAVAKGVSTTVRLKQPVPVLIAYSTVIVRGGSVYFYPDVYGEDAKLDRALRGR